VFDGQQNTDPFVFDGPFIYSICQQPKKPSLRSLEPGDVILFGSSLGGHFILDTVFVVLSREPYQPRTEGPATAPPSFRTVTHWPLSQRAKSQACAESNDACSAGEELAFYRGATPEQRVEGMFSFAPAIIASASRQSFRRPWLAPSGVLETCISPGLTQGVKITPMETRAVWDEVVRRARAEQLLLGVAFDT